MDVGGFAASCYGTSSDVVENEANDCRGRAVVKQLLLGLGFHNHGMDAENDVNTTLCWPGFL